jgi:hypothetical protein
MARFTVAGHQVELEHEDVERSVDGLLPDPVHEHYVVVEGRRFPPKQVLARATGLDRADFTTHQARRILKRLGFVAGRRTDGVTLPRTADDEVVSEQAEVLRPYIDKWVAMANPTHVLVAADTPQEVLAWLARHERRAPYGMFRVPSSVAEAEGAAPA